MGQIGLRGVYIYALTKRQCTSVDLSLRLLNYGPVLYLNLRGIKRWQVDEEHFIKLIWIVLCRLVYMCVSFKIVKKSDTKKKKTNLGQSIVSVCGWGVCDPWGWGVDLCTNTRIGNKCHWHKAYQFSILYQNISAWMRLDPI